MVTATLVRTLFVTLGIVATYSTAILNNSTSPAISALAHVTMEGYSEDNATTTMAMTTAASGVDDGGFKCQVRSVDPFIGNKVRFLVVEERASLVEYVFTFQNYSSNPLLTDMKEFYHADKWSRVTTSHGQTLLSLAFNYGILSMSTLRFGTTTLPVELAEDPPGCMGVANETQKIATVRHLLMRDFKTSGNETLVGEERVCHEVVLGVDGYAFFKDRCYFRDPFSLLIKTEDDVDTNFWLTILYSILVIVRLGLLLFGPCLFISAVESMSVENIPYVVKLKDTFQKTVCIAHRATQLDKNLKFKRIVDLRSRKGLYKLKESASSLIPGQPSKVVFSQYDITVSYKRMQTENIVDVGLMNSLYRAFFKCKIRHVGPFQTCCKSNMLSGCSKDKEATPLPWIRMCRKAANAMLIVFLPLPYYIRLIVFYMFEYEEVMSRKSIIAANGLRERYENSMIHYFTPSHPIFIIIYLIYACTAILLAFMSRKYTEARLLKIIVGSFRDLRTLQWTETISMVAANILWPLKRYGLLGLLVGLLYWPIAVPFTIAIGLVYALPTVYLAIRMGFYSKSAIFERSRKRKKNKPYQVSVKADMGMHKFAADHLLAPADPDNDDDLGLDDIDNIAPNEHFKNLKDNISLASSIVKYQAKNWKRFIVYILSAILCIATLFALVIILSEVIGCLVEVVVFTIMGIIVNASALLKYVMLLLMIFVYSCDCFNNMEKKYLKLNKALFGEVKSRIKDLSDVTSLPSFLQENRGFKSQELGEQADYESPDDVAVKPPNHWMINDLVLFIDSDDMPRIPRQLFDEVCQIRVAGLPGPVFHGLLEAFEQFLKAVVFVLFVFIIVLTFGAVYRVSSTNQMLATMVGGFLPMMLKTFLAPPTPDVEVGTVSFRSKLDEVIKNFCQYWPIYDLPFDLFVEKKPEEEKGPDGAEESKIASEEPVKDTKTDSKDEKKKNDAKNSAENSPTKCPAPSYGDATGMLNYMTNLGDMHGEHGFHMGDMSNNNYHGHHEELGSDRGGSDWGDAPSPATPMIEKCVRIFEEPPVDEVDILIYMPDKYDDVWLDEWSDIASRGSRHQVSAGV